MRTVHLAATAIALVMTSSMPPSVAQERSLNPRVGQLAAIHFAHGSAALSLAAEPDLLESLGRVAGWAADNPDGLIVLDGHADRTGPTQVNVRLSLERARAVREKLVSVGVDPDQIVIAAFGESAPQQTPRRLNRRVMIWGTRAGLAAVVARSHARGEPVIRAGEITAADLPRPRGAVATR